MYDGEEEGEERIRGVCCVLLPLSLGKSRESYKSVAPLLLGSQRVHVSSGSAYLLSYGLEVII